MIMKLLHRLHEKLADRFTFIQYPDIRPADQRTREASRSPGLHFKHAMPIEQRVGLVLVSLVMLAAAIAGMAAAGFLVYVVAST
jgi:hypothetical protein